MAWTSFIPPYPNGYENGESGGTPVTAEILNTNYDAFLLALNSWAAEVGTDISNKVDKVTGKQLSDENYTSTEKTKLAGIAEGATAVVANPSDSSSTNLTKIKIGGSVYLIPQGGSGGSSVSWTQIQATGTKIATITIDGVPTDVYAPNGGSGGGDSVSWTQVVQSGTKIGTITINNVATDVYVPAVPTNTSDLTNDSNFVSDSSYVHTDNNYTTTEKNKLADLNQVVANPSSGTSAGDLSSISIGGTKYDIPTGGGGGTTVIANPSGSATDELEKLQVGSTIYSLPTGAVITKIGTLDVGGQWVDYTYDLTDVDTIRVDCNGDSYSIYTNLISIYPSYYSLFTIDGVVFNIAKSSDEQTLYVSFNLSTSLTADIYAVVGSESGGGTTVIPNPQGTPTDELETIQIGNDIYSLPEGGGSGDTSYFDFKETLTAGETEVTFTSGKIKTNSVVDPYTNVFGVNPTDMVVQNGSCTLTFAARQTDMDVLLRVSETNLPKAYDIELIKLVEDVIWFYWDYAYINVSEGEDRLVMIEPIGTPGSWTTFGAIGIDLQQYNIPSNLSAIKVHFNKAKLNEYTAVRFMNSDTFYSGSQSGNDAMLRMNGFYQWMDQTSPIVGIDELDYTLTIPCTAQDLSSRYLYIMAADGMVQGTTTGYNNGLEGTFNVQIDGINFVTGGN